MHTVFYDEGPDCLRDGMSIVVKRDGKREKFDSGKIKRSIENAAREADIPEDRRKALQRTVAKNIIRSGSNDKEVRSTELRDRILLKLDSEEPRVARSWRDHDREAKGLA